MSTADMQVDIRGLQRLQKKLRKLRPAQLDDALEQVAGVAKKQTLQRMQDDKESPGGEKWAPWSDRYKSTRHGNHALLDNVGNLIDSISTIVGRGQVFIGSNLDYAMTHQKGRGEIPARPYLGLSSDNETEVEDIVLAHIETVLARS